MRRLILAAIAALSIATSAFAAGPQPVPNPWVVVGNSINYGGCVLLPSAVTGGCKGAGSINVQAIYVNGLSIGQQMTNSVFGYGRCDGTTTSCSGGVISAIGGGAVSSVFTRTGEVTAQSGDYTVSQITGAAPLASPNFTGTASFAGAMIASSLSTGTQVSCLGLDSTNHIIPATGACGIAGGGTVASIGNASADTSLTLAGTGSGPFTGAVTAKLNLGNANTWTVAQTFSAGIIDGIIKPASDSTTAVQIQNAAGSASIITIDTTNGRLGINATGQTFVAAAVGGSSTTASMIFGGSLVSTSSNIIAIHNDTNAAAGELGINNSGATGSSLVNQANSMAIYQFIGTGGLYLGTTVATAPVVFFTGGSAAGNKRGQIGATSGGWCIGNCSQDSGAGTIAFAGSSSGATALQAAATASGTLTMPPVTDTLAVLGTSQSFSNTQTFAGTFNNTGTFQINSNTITWPSAAITVARIDAAQTFAGTQTYTGRIVTAASVTGGAGLNLPQGTAPTSPVNGDMWATSLGVFAQIAGSTVGPFGTGGSSGLHETLVTTTGSGSFTPTNTALYKITIIAGGGLGGQGGSSTGVGGGGGGGAGATCYYYATLTASTAYTLTVGLGSTIGSPTAGNSTFVNGATTVTAGHGSNGAAPSGALGGIGGATGNCTNATFGPVNGGDGQTGGTSDADLSGTSTGAGGTGGGGGGVGGTVAAGVGSPGLVFGSAGGGAPGSAVNGQGAGKQGAILIEAVY